MFKLSEKYEIDKRFSKCDYITCSPSEISTTNTPNSQIYIKILRRGSVFSLLYSYIELNFDVLHASTGNRYADGDDIRLVNLGPIALFSSYKLKNSSGKHLEEISRAHIASLMFKLLISNVGCHDLPIGFDRSRDRKKQELTITKKTNIIRIYLGDIFGFGEHQKTATYGLGYKLTLTRNTDNAVLNKDNATNNAKIKIIALERYVPQYTPSFEDYNNILQQITKETPTNLHYPKKSVFMKKMKTQNFSTFEIGVREGINVPIWIYVVFQQSDRQHNQNLNNDTFYRMPITSCQCIIGTEKYPDNAILLNYNDNDYSQGYGQIKEAFKALTKDIILQQYTTENDSRSSNERDNIGYIIRSFDIRYPKNFESVQLSKIEFKLDGIAPIGIYGYALVLTNRLVSKNSDGQRKFDLF